MRDFRDAKTMAQSLRKALAAHAVTQNHSQCLELIAQAFGLENWNTLSAKIDAAGLAEPRPPPAANGSTTIVCSFCGNPQHGDPDLVALEGKTHSGIVAQRAGSDLYDEAVAVVIRDRKASISYIQRRLQIGYNRAASLMERMEREGVVGPANHDGKREVHAVPPPHEHV